VLHNDFRRNNKNLCFSIASVVACGGYDTALNTVVAKDIYAHAKALAQCDLDAKRLLSVLEAIPPELERV
jgi:hypothetical protein